MVVFAVFALCAAMGLHLGAGWCIKRSERLSTELDDPDLLGNLLMDIALAQYFGGRLEDAKQSYEQANPLLRRCGDKQLLHSVHLYTQTGDLNTSSQTPSEIWFEIQTPQS